ncbi:MAG: helix-turn-helix transcriptional regulator [Niabella sp.]
MHIKVILVLAVCGLALTVNSQQLGDVAEKAMEDYKALKRNNQTKAAINILNKAITYKNNTAVDMAYLYANVSGLYVTIDSLILGKDALDNSFEYAQKAQTNEAMAVAYRASAFLNDALNEKDAVVEDAKLGLKLLEGNNTDLETKFTLNYLLYGVYSNWNDEEKMSTYIQECKKYALLANNPNMLANVYNGISSMFIIKWEKTKNKNFTDSSHFYLKNSFNLHQTQPNQVAGGTFVITCVNLANYYLSYSSEPNTVKKTEAFKYLDFAEKELNKTDPKSRHWVNIYGIKSDFALRENNLDLAEIYLMEGITKTEDEFGYNADAQYTLYDHLAKIAAQKNNYQSAYNYRQKAESVLKTTFNHNQLYNTQKLEIQYETEKQQQEFELLNQKAEAGKKEKHLYLGISLALVLGLIFMFRAYYFKLKYSVEREKKLQQDKEETERNAQMQMKLEKEEQGRLKAEQELLELQQQQLRKEVMANNLMLEQKNETLKLIQSKIKNGEAKEISKLLKEDGLLSGDFDELRTHIQQLHPNFFHKLSELAIQKLTPLDLKYCAYLNLKLSTRQIAQLLHIETQSVRTFKYRLKQKFGLNKDTDLEIFIQQIKA